MNRYRSRLIKWIAIVLISFIVLVFAANIIISRYAHNRVQAALSPIDITLGSLSVNIFLQKITLSELHSTNEADTLKAKIDIVKMVFSDVSFYELLANKRVCIGEILIEDGQVRVDLTQNLKDTTSSKKTTQLKGVSIGQISLKNLSAELLDSGASYAAELNITLKNIESSGTSTIEDIKSYMMKGIEARINNVAINHSNGLYQTKISAVRASSDNRNIIIDSLVLIPRHAKYRFAKIAAKQTDRINAYIRKMEIKGIRFDPFNDSTFAATNISIDDAEVYSFRDKRLPFKEIKIKPLPMEALRSIGLGIEVDTIRINSSKVTYEEFPEEGFESGKIVFADLNATLTNLANRHYYNKSEFATLSATAKLMNKGLIKATFLLPIKKDLQYHAEGSVGGMSFFPLNPTLENLAFIRVESGKLNSIHFNFDYNDRTSNGKLTINYEDLKITGLKKEKSGGDNDLKTFLINTVIKNDKNQDMPTEKRTGEIFFERDRKRQIFNFWWKSLFSGITASVLNAEKKKND